MRSRETPHSAPGGGGERRYGEEMGRSAPCAHSRRASGKKSPQWDAKDTPMCGGTPYGARDPIGYQGPHNVARVPRKFQKPHRVPGTPRSARDPIMWHGSLGSSKNPIGCQGPHRVPGTPECGRDPRIWQGSPRGTKNPIGCHKPHHMVRALLRCQRSP